MPFQRKLVVPTCLVEQLPEEITITEGFPTQIRVVVNLSWQLTVIIIVIQFTGKTIGGIYVPSRHSAIHRDNRCQHRHTQQQH